MQASTRSVRVATVAAVGLAVAAATAFALATQPRSYTLHYDNVLGTSMDLTIRAASDRAADAAESAALWQIDHDAKILSAYDPDSEFSRWFRTSGEPIRVSRELFDVLQLFDRWRERTAGALDASAEQAARVWRVAASTGRLPSDEDLAAAVSQIRQPHWRLDPVARTATHLSTTPLVLNSFTKSYIVDRAARAALASGPVRAAVVNIGGDLVARGAWTETVGVTDPLDNADNGTPLARLAVRNRAVATSGGYRRGFDVAGHHYSHIVDPRTGRPTGHVLSATVVAGDAVNAGALATALCVLAPEDGKALAAGVPDAEFLMVLADGREVASPGWRAIAAPVADHVRVTGPVATVYAAEQTWNPAFELAITLELARPDFRARRPYVAVWIEDKDRLPLRVLALWYESPRYLPELRAWSRADALRKMAEGTRVPSSVSGATRSPGRYTLAWDGKDQQGRLVKPGSYTVFIEVTREHGTYQLMRQALDFSGTPARVELPANVEVAGVVLDYHKISGR
jgi:thiamine biosynthesis lipoprotein ApbE